MAAARFADRAESLVQSFNQRLRVVVPEPGPGVADPAAGLSGLGELDYQPSSLLRLIYEGVFLTPQAKRPGGLVSHKG